LGKRRGSVAERTLLWREKVGVSMAKDPFPFAKAAPVRAFKAPLICNALYEEKLVNKSRSPLSDRAVRFGSEGISPILLADIV